MIHYRWIRTFLITIPIIVFLWLLAQEFVVTGRMNIRYNFSYDTPFIKRLWPPGRIDPIERDATGDAFQRIRIDPVTFDVRLPRAFRSAVVRLMYQKQDDQPFFIGIQKTRGVWAPVLRAVRPVGTTRDWQIGEARFADLTPFDFTDNKYQFVLSVPGLHESGHSMTITAIEFALERESFTLGNFFPRLWKFFAP